MPERLSYDEAMLFSSVRLKIADPEIKRGKVETVTVSTQVGKMMRPWGIEGGFAVVYKFRTLSGQVRALRCFRVPMKPDTQFRYERLGPYFHQHVAAITAGFKYHDQGILVKEQGKPAGGTVYPIIEMDWIDGVTLIDKVEELCQKRDCAALKSLSEQWLAILIAMHNAHIAHGDLAAVNVMVRADGRMVLIDYDGVYIPEFAALPQILLGQSDFQHPQMGQRPFDEHMDAFSALVIYTALLALSVQPELWHKYMKRNPQGVLLDVNLMLTQRDFKEPQQSPLLRDLERSSNQQVRTLARALKRACELPVAQVRFPFDLIDPDYDKKLAFETLVRAIQSDDDTQIATAWVPTLEQYGQAQSHRGRVQLAKRRLAALVKFRAALQSQQTARIVADYDTALDAHLTANEKKLLDLAQRFVKACNTNDDEAMITLSESIQKDTTLVLTAQEQQRVTQALRRKNAQQHYQTALNSRDPAQIATAYATLQQHVYFIPEQERQLGELATNFMQAYRSNDDDVLIAACDAIQNFKYRTSFTFSAEQKQRIDAALQREQAITQFRVALISRNISKIGDAFSTSVETCSRLTPEELEQGRLARAFALAHAQDNDDALVTAARAIQAAPASYALTLTNEETQRIELAQQRREAHIKLQFALATKKPQIIVASYNPLVHNLLTPEARELLSLARRIVDACDDAQLYEAYAALQRSRYRDLLEFPPQDEPRMIALQTLETALHRKEPEAIIAAYESLPSSLEAQLTAQQSQLVENARNAISMRNTIQQAIQEKDDRAILKAYDPALAQHFPQLLQPWIYHHIDNARRTQQIQIARRGNDYEAALRIARENQTTETLNGQQSFLIVAMRRVLRDIQLSGVDAWIEATRNGNLLNICWHWPDNDLIPYVVLLWDEHTQPRLPRQLSEHELRGVKNCVRIARDLHRREGQQIFAVKTQTFVFTTLYAAMYDEWDKNAEVKTWCFSPAVERTARIRDKAPTSR